MRQDRFEESLEPIFRDLHALRVLERDGGPYPAVTHIANGRTLLRTTPSIDNHRGRHKMTMRRLGLGTLTALALLLTAVPAGAVSAKSRLLSVTALPTGWIVTYHRDSREVFSSRCLSALEKTPKSEKGATVAFAEGDARNLAEKLVTGPVAVERLRLLNRELRACRRVRFTAHGTALHLRKAKIALPKVGPTSASFSFRGSVTGVTIEADVVTFRASRFVGYIIYRTFTSVNARTAAAYAEEAVAKAEGKHVVPPSTTTA